MIHSTKQSNSSRERQSQKESDETRERMSPRESEKTRERPVPQQMQEILLEHPLKMIPIPPHGLLGYVRRLDHQKYLVPILDHAQRHRVAPLAHFRITGVTGVHTEKGEVGYVQ